MEETEQFHISFQEFFRAYKHQDTFVMKLHFHSKYPGLIKEEIK